MNAALPDIIDRLVTVLPTLSAGWTVFDGQPLTRDSLRDFVTVGFVDGEDVAGSVEPIETLGDLEEEAGSVRSEFVSQTGDETDMRGRRLRVFELYNALNAWVRANPTLGVASVSSAALTADLLPVQNTGGAASRLAVTLSYTASGV